jgi:hypothetical protein
MCEGMDGAFPLQDSVQWRVLVNTVQNLTVPLQEGVSLVWTKLCGFRYWVQIHTRLPESSPTRDINSSPF